MHIRLIVYSNPLIRGQTSPVIVDVTVEPIWIPE